MPKKAVKRSGKRSTSIWKSLTVILILLGVGVIGYGLTYRVPDTLPKKVSETLYVSYQSPSITVTDSNGNNVTILTPPVTLDLDTTFEAQGSFGARNPITISAVITEANTTVTKYYCCLLFTGAVPPNIPWAAEFDWLTLTNRGDGTYTAGGVLEWPDGGPTYTWLMPNFPEPLTQYRIPLEMITSGGRLPTLTIEPMSATLAWQNAQQETQLGYAELGIAIIGLVSLAEVVRRLIDH